MNLRTHNSLQVIDLTYNLRGQLNHGLNIHFFIYLIVVKHHAPPDIEYASAIPILD